MPCPKCKTNRVYRYSEVVCPVCQSLKIIASKEEITQRQEALKVELTRFDELINGCNQEALFWFAFKEREEISKKIIGNVWNCLNEVWQWQAFRYLIGKCDRNKKNGESSERQFNDLVKLSSDIISQKNAICKLQRKQALVIEVSNQKEFCLTEAFPLSFIPQKVENDIKKALNIDNTILDQWDGDIRKEHTESIRTQVLALEPASEMIKSEKISRQLKTSSADRIFPSINGSEGAQKFINMTTALLEDLLVFAWKTLGKDSVVQFSKVTMQSFNKFSKLSPDDVSWYLNVMKEFIIYSNEGDSLFVPFATVQMLQLSSYRWSGLPQVGKELNFIGKTVEDLIFNLVQSYDGKTLHPLTKEPLVRIINPLTKEELADVIIFDANRILVIESKFWDCPNLSALEEQLDNFRNKVDYFFANRKQLGFPEADIFPVFYTPFPPCSNWHGIQLIPSQFLVGWYVGSFFKPKKPTLIVNHEKLRALVFSEDYPIPYPIDGNELDKTIPINTVRLTDGWVDKFNDHEISLKIMNPIGDPVIIILDITEQTFTNLNESNIKPGDFLRFGCVNHSGSWTITQFLYYQKLDENNPRRKIQELYGNSALAMEVISAFESNKLDIFKFIEFCKTRTPSLSLLNDVVAARIGAVLNICDTFDFVAQCKCGNILGLNSSIVSQRKAMSGGQLLCGSCLQKYLSTN